MTEKLTASSPGKILGDIWNVNRCFVEQNLNFLWKLKFTSHENTRTITYIRHVHMLFTCCHLVSWSVGCWLNNSFFFISSNYDCLYLNVSLYATNFDSFKMHHNMYANVSCSQLKQTFSEKPSPSIFSLSRF